MKKQKALQPPSGHHALYAHNMAIQDVWKIVEEIGTFTKGKSHFDWVVLFCHAAARRYGLVLDMKYRHRTSGCMETLLFHARPLYVEPISPMVGDKVWVPVWEDFEYAGPGNDMLCTNIKVWRTGVLRKEGRESWFVKPSGERPLKEEGWYSENLISVRAPAATPTLQNANVCEHFGNMRTFWSQQAMRPLLMEKEGALISQYLLPIIDDYERVEQALPLSQEFRRDLYEWFQQAQGIKKDRAVRRDERREERRRRDERREESRKERRKESKEKHKESRKERHKESRK